MRSATKFRTAALFATAALLASSAGHVLAAAPAAKPAPPPAPSAAPAAAAAAAAPGLPGLTATDMNPNGCVSCHKGDTSIDKLLKKVKHKNVDKKTKTVPDDCNSCHEGDEDVDPLSVLMHVAHYGAGAKSEFVSRQGGQCLHCHSLDVETGKVGVKKGARNW